MGGCCCSSFCGQFLLARVHWVRAQEPLDPSVHGRAKQAPHREFKHSFSTQVCGLISLTGLPSVKEMYQGKGTPEVVYEGFWTLWKCQGINMGTKWRFARLVLSVLGMSCLMLLLAVLPCCVPCLCHTLYLCCKAALRYLLRVLLVEKNTSNWSSVSTLPCSLPNAQGSDPRMQPALSSRFHIFFTYLLYLLIWFPWIQGSNPL